ncbi:unnamed protein product, partial [Polarella glacialis]
ALQQQRVVEPHEHILRAKVLSNLGQCYLATGEHDEADIYYSEAYELFDKTVGKRSPLFGMQAWACGNLRCAEGRYAEALPLLGEALYVETVKDGLSVSEMTKLADQILHSLHESRAELGERNSQANLEPIKRALNTLIQDPRWDELESSIDLAVLSHKMALIYVAARWSGSGEQLAARSFSSQAVAMLRELRAAGGASLREAQQWLVQAEAVQSVLRPPEPPPGAPQLGLAWSESAR